MTICKHCGAELKTHAQILLHALREDGPKTKHQVRDELGIENVGGRILDLREAGHEIETRMIKVPSRYGDATVAQYRYVKPREQMPLPL